MSLIEITIVILLIGLVAAIVSPRLSDHYRMVKLRSAARQLASHIDYVRNSAMNRGRDLTLVFDNVEHSYRCESLDLPARLGTLLSVRLPKDYDSSFTLDANIDSQSSLTFDFEGFPLASGTMMSSGVVIIASGSDRFAVTIAAGSGETEVTQLFSNALPAVEQGMLVSAEVESVP